MEELIWSPGVIPDSNLSPAAGVVRLVDRPFGSTEDLSGTPLGCLTSERLLVGDEDTSLGRSRFIDSRGVRVVGGEGKSGHDD